MEWRVYEKLFTWLRSLADDIGEVADTARQAERAQLRVETDAELARRELADLDKQLETLTTQLAAGRVPEHIYDSTRDTIMSQRGEAEKRLRLAEQAPKRREPAHATARGLLDEWDTLPVLERRELLSQLISGIWVTPAERRTRSGATMEIAPVWGA